MIEYYRTMKSVKKIIVVGANGRMGSVVAQTLKDDGIEVAEIDKDCGFCDAFDGEMIIDFASAASSVESAKFALKHKIPLIIGATGQSNEQKQFILSSGEYIPVLLCSNFSVGIAKLKCLIRDILKLNIENVCIFESHHKNKIDSPSGTALELLDLVGKNYGGDIQVLSERGGMEIGTHKIDFYFGAEKLTISHQVFSRQAFADGVLIAVKNMENLGAGVYNFEHFVQNIQIKNH